MKVFFDCEFTGLREDTELISIGFVASNWERLYIQFTDYDRDKLDSWVRRNVLSNLLNDEEMQELGGQLKTVAYNLNKTYADNIIRAWFAGFDNVELWSDVQPYDTWLLLKLLGFKLPDNVNYIVRDLATALELKGVDPDSSRFDLLGDSGGHNALIDAQQQLEIYNHYISDDTI